MLPKRAPSYAKSIYKLRHIFCSDFPEAMEHPPSQRHLCSVPPHYEPAVPGTWYVAPKFSNGLEVVYNRWYSSGISKHIQEVQEVGR